MKQPIVGLLGWASHRPVVGLIIALVASSGQSPVQPSALAEAAAPTAVEVRLLDVTPGTPASNGVDWCVGSVASAPAVTLTADVVTLAAPQSEVSEGTVEWQVCESGGMPRQGSPKDGCDVGHGSARWRGAVLSDLSFDSTPSLVTRFQLPVLGFRLQYHPASGSGFERATSVSFNLDRTCP